MRRRRRGWRVKWWRGWLRGRGDDRAAFVSCGGGYGEELPLTGHTCGTMMGMMRR